MSHEPLPHSEPIAVVGMGCRFPGGANSPAAFWQLLRAGVDAVGPIPPSRWDVEKYYAADRNAAGKMYIREGAFLSDEEITHFDPRFFRMSPREAASLDPQQRLLLEVSWEALEHGGQAPARLEGSRTGVFVGSFWDDYSAERFYLAPLRQIDAFTTLSGVRGLAAGRIAHALNLHGPALQLDTACSSSLMAVHLAVQSLRNGESDLALAGGVSLILSPRLLIGNSRMNALSTDGRCRAFAANTDGFGRGEGCGMVVLKRYGDAVRDGDTILACLRGSAANHDGRSLSLTTPNIQAQQAVIEAALANAGVPANAIQYLEAHGTGTPLGDPIELTAIGKVFGPTRATPLLVGSVKTNISHLDPAAGVSGLIKVVLAMQHGEIPPHLHFDHPNPSIRWDRLPVQVPTTLTPWPAQPKLAGVSAFGISGTNVHVVVEEAPPAVAPSVPPERSYHLLTLSAQNEQALQDLAGRYADWMRPRVSSPTVREGGRPMDTAMKPALPHGRATDTAHALEDNCPETLGDTLGDICYTAAIGRSHFAHRIALLADSHSQLREQVNAVVNGKRAEGVIRLRRGQEAHKPRIAFLFTGQGSQYVNMGKQLYVTHPLFRRIINQCDEILRPYLELPLLTVLYPEFAAESDALSNDQKLTAPIHQTTYAQPALFAVEYALAQMWQSWGIEPDVVLGHSTGEYVAACVAGVFGLEDGLKLIATRARLIASVAQASATAAVLAEVEQVRAVLRPYAGQVEIAGINGPLETLIAGEATAVDAAITALAATGLESRRLAIPHAPHSPLMEPILDEFEALARQIPFHPPQCQFISNVTGSALTSLDAHYWRRHMREPVRFNDGLNQLATEGCNVMIEVGPQPVLQLLGRQNWRGPKGVRWLGSLWSVQDDWAQLLHSAGELYVQGVKLDWARFERAAGAVGSRRKIALPTYPFQRERCWTEAPDGLAQSDDVHHPLLGKPLHSVAFQQDELIFSQLLSAQTPTWLQDHRAAGRVLLPASAYLEMALAFGRQQFQGESLVVEDVTFQRALILPEDGARQQVQCLATPGRSGYRWQIYAAPDNTSEGLATAPPTWTAHAEGTVRPAETQAFARLNLPALKTLQNEISQPVNPATLYDRFQQVGLQYGPHFRLIRQLWRSADRALAQVQLSQRLAQEADQYQLHPALLDACLQVSALLFLDEARDALDEVYLPIGIDRLSYAGRPEQQALTELWCSAQVRNALPGQFTIDLQLFAQSGDAVATMQGLQVRAVPIQSLAGTEGWRDWLYQVTWHCQELPPRPLTVPAAIHWLLLADANGIGQQTAQFLRNAGAQVTVVTPGAHYAQVDAATFQIDPHAPADYRTLLQTIPAVTNVLHGWSLDFTQSELTSVDHLQQAAAVSCGSLLYLLQALDDVGALPAFYLLTQGAVACGPQQALVGLAQAPLWGMGKVIPLEYPTVTCVCLDVDPRATAPEIAALLAAELTQATLPGFTPEEQIAYRLGMRYVARLETFTPTRADENCHWQVAEKGRLETLQRVALPRRLPAAGEVEIEMCAAGLNFRDVLSALGLYPGNAAPLGLEGVGRIVAVGAAVDDLAPGDRVMALSTGCFSRALTVDRRLVVPVPEEIQDVEAATIPSAFVTTWHCLQQLAALKAGERVLIHTASGGIGQAAIQLAQLAGAEIFATASPAKWPVLQSLGVRHLYNSRTPDFGAAILAETDGRGVDVVLNTLTGTGFIEQSLLALRRGGVFLELSKRDVWSSAQMAAARPDVRYHLFDQAQSLVQEPQLVQEQLQTIATLLAQRKLRPIPQTTFAMRDMVSAFRTMQQAAHTGKLALLHTPHRPVSIDATATYLITGGLGGLGLTMAQGLVEQGARRLLLVSRRPPSDAVERQLNELRQMGATILTAPVDVANGEQMTELFATIPPEHPLKGIIHAAGALDDGMMVNQNWERFTRVLAPKLDGSWHLHQLTKGLPLDFFLLFSSATSLLGLAGQANYAAANAFLEALAHHRQALGLPALAINWGLWDEVGSATQFVTQLKALGLGFILPQQGKAVVKAVLSETIAQLGVIPINWQRFKSDRAFFAKLKAARRARSVSAADAQEAEGFLWAELQNKSSADQTAHLRHHIQTEIASLLRYATPTAVPLQLGFRELGMDSLTSMELRSRLQRALDCTLPAAVVFNYPTVETLATYLLDRVLSQQANAPSVTGLSVTPIVEQPRLAPLCVASEMVPQAPLREYTISVQGLDLCLCEWGDPSGKPILCVHGTYDQGLSWEGVANELAAQGHRVIAIDLRGHGRSAHLGPEGLYQLLDFVGDLAELIQHLGGHLGGHLGSQPITLVGHSLGAIIAVLCTAAHPAHIERLVLLEPPLRPLPEELPTFLQQMDTYQKAMTTIRPHTRMPDLHTAAERLRQVTPTLSPADALRRAERLTRPQADGVIWRWDARLDGEAQLAALFAGMRKAEFLQLLSQIPAPVTIAYGDASGWLTPAEKAKLQQARPSLQPIVLPGGHNLHLDAPAALAKIILRTMRAKAAPLGAA